MAQHQAPQHNVSPEMTARHTTGWRNFMRAATYGAAAVAVVLVLLDLFLVR